MKKQVNGESADPMATNQTITSPTPTGYYTSAVLTDKGICVGMRNVNLNSQRTEFEHHHHTMPGWYNNLHVMNQLAKPHMWNNGYATYFCTDAGNPNDFNQIHGQSGRSYDDNNSYIANSFSHGYFANADKSQSANATIDPMEKSNRMPNNYWPFASSEIKTAQITSITQSASQQFLQLPNGLRHQHHSSIWQPAIRRLSDAVTNDVNQFTSPPAILVSPPTQTLQHPPTVATTSKRPITSTTTGSLSTQQINRMDEIVSKPNNDYGHVAAPKKKWIQQYTCTNKYHT